MSLGPEQPTARVQQRRLRDRESYSSVEESRGRPNAGLPAGSLAPVRRTHYLLVGAIGLLATLPFVNKAYHIDDILYLQGTSQVLAGHDAYHGYVLWDAPDGEPSPLFLTDYNPPIWKYVLAGTIALFGREEWKLHLLESLFAWLAGFGVFQVSRRFSRSPVWCTAMALLSPFFLPGQNIMLEGPLLCFVVWALEFQFRAWESGKTRWAWLAGLLLALAVMTKYSAGVLCVLFVAGAIWSRQPASAVALAPPAITLTGWLLYNLEVYGRSHLGVHGVTFGWADWPVRVLIVLRCVGAVTVFGPAVGVLLYRRGLPGRWLLALCLLAAAGLAWVDLRQVREYRQLEGWNLSALQNRLQDAHFLAFTFHGAFTCLGIASRALLAWRGGERSLHRFDRTGFLELWLALFFLFNVACVPFNAVRHLLLFCLPTVWLLGQSLDHWPERTALRRGMAIASAVLGLALADADYELAGSYRHVAHTAVRHLVRDQAQAGRNVWFTGTWGFAYYAHQEGANPLIRDPAQYGFPPVRAGDRIVKPELLTWNPLVLPRGHERWPVEHVQPAASNPLRTVAAGVHYYAVLRHTLPWQLLIAPAESPGALYELPDLDEILIYEVIPMRGHPFK